MSGLKDQGAGWRKKLRNWLDKQGINSYDPCIEEMEEYNDYAITDPSNWESLPQQLQETIIDKDLEEIKYRTDFIICYFTRYSTGTVSELTFAHYHQIPILMVSDVPLVGWPLTISRSKLNKVFYNFNALKKFIKETYVR